MSFPKQNKYFFAVALVGVAILVGCISYGKITGIYLVKEKVGSYRWEGNIPSMWMNSLFAGILLTVFGVVIPLFRIAHRWLWFSAMKQSTLWNGKIQEIFRGSWFWRMYLHIDLKGEDRAELDER